MKAGGGGGTDSTNHVGGRWSEDECPNHINSLELFAAKLILQALLQNVTGAHVRIMTDNTTAICYINKMGGTRAPECNKVTYEIWQWCINKGIWLSAAHIPGRDNKVADFKSRNFIDNKEWSLCDKKFNSIVKHLFLPEIDLFASRLNKKVDKFISWKPEPGCWAVDAFSVNWSHLRFYAFPPFKLIGRVLAKIQKEEATGILVPYWTTQPWFAQLVNMLITDPFVLLPHRNLLYLPGQHQHTHPLHRQLHLLVVLISGKRQMALQYQTKLGSLSVNLGEDPLKHSMTPLGEISTTFVGNDKWIPFIPI